MPGEDQVELTRNSLYVLRRAEARVSRNQVPCCLFRSVLVADCLIGGIDHGGVRREIGWSFSLSIIHMLTLKCKGISTLVLRGTTLKLSSGLQAILYRSIVRP